MNEVIIHHPTEAKETLTTGITVTKEEIAALLHETRGETLDEIYSLVEKKLLGRKYRNALQGILGHRFSVDQLDNLRLSEKSPLAEEIRNSMIFKTQVYHNEWGKLGTEFD